MTFAESLQVTQQAMNYAIRYVACSLTLSDENVANRNSSGVTITAGYAIRQSARLLKNVKGTEKDELQPLQQRLQNKIRIISPAIDMIELIAARGNTSLESAVSLTKTLRWEIQALGQRLERAASAEESARKSTSSTRARAENEAELKLVIRDVRKLLERIEDAVPLINLAITTSGASLSTTLPATVSPSRLLQASTFLTTGDTQYSMSSNGAFQVGPTFTLSVYMLFAGHIRPQDEEGVRESTWKEVMHKARVKLRRVPMEVALKPESTSTPNGVGSPEAGNFGARIAGTTRADEFAYQLMIIEDLNDDRVHTLEDDDAHPEPFDDVELAGIREIVPIHEISKIFYADTGKVLNIGSEGETNNPVLLLKRDVNAVPPRRMMDRTADLDDEEEGYPDTEMNSNTHSDTRQKIMTSQSSDPWRLPPGLDPEWLAFEVYTEAEDSDDESEAEAPPRRQESRAQSLDPHLTSPLARLNLNDDASAASSPAPRTDQQLSYDSPSRLATHSNPLFNSIRTSLSLLETLLRLTSLQQFQQQSHLSITDELLNFFLEESSTTGAGGDERHRQYVRAEARRKVGFDPYDESPIKRRGEEYQYKNGEAEWASSPRSDNGYGYQSADNGYGEIPGTPPLARSLSGIPSSPYGRVSPSPSMDKGRPAFLKKQPDRFRGGSPLARPGTGHTDEGIGMSPDSQAPEGVKKQT